nr:14713_t:CDS:2 [Entrophospora candida]
MSKPKVCITLVDGFIGYEIAKHLTTTSDLKNKIQSICAIAEDESQLIDLKDKVDAASKVKVKNCIVILMAATDIADQKSHSHLCEFQKIKLKKEHFQFQVEMVNAPADLLDVAEATSLLLSNPDKMKEYSGQLLTMTGPTAMTGQQMAQHILKVVGKEIKFEDISNEEALKILSNIKMLDESEKMLLLEFYDLVKAHRTNFVTAHEFKIMTGRNPSSLDNFIQRYKADLK